MRSAAICYRRRGSRIEFLLVRTMGGKRWTFPKGHVEKKKDERPARAAAREAREEAGARGRVDAIELLRYRYPSGSTAKPDHVVRAFLMEVTDVAPAEEPWRKPRWFSPARARVKLAEGRAARYAGEHARLLEAALAKLGGRLAHPAHGSRAGSGAARVTAATGRGGAARARPHRS